MSPVPPLLYVLVAEVLACNIRSSALIFGLSLPGSLSSFPVVLLMLMILRWTFLICWYFGCL